MTQGARKSTTYILKSKSNKITQNSLFQKLVHFSVSIEKLTSLVENTPLIIDNLPMT
jgi:hypothetical protein